MLRVPSSRPSPAMVVAVIALFVALGGSGYAAVKINGKDIANRSISGKKLRKSAVTSREVRNGSLRAGDFKRGQLREGREGPPGPKGEDGEPGEEGLPGEDGEPGSALAYVRVSKTGDVDASDSKNFPVGNVHRGLPDSGTYCLRGLRFSPNNVVATLGTDGPGIGIAADLGGGFGCPVDTQIVVLTFSEVERRDNNFMLAVN